nr:hypothetical protein [Flavobacterium sp.]
MPLEEGIIGMEVNLAMVLIKSIKFCFVIITVNSFLVFSQQSKKRNVIEYLNMSSFSLAKNHDNYYFRTDKMKHNGTSVGFDINTIHGIKFFELVSISGGIAIDLNLNENILSNPYFFDFRIFSNRTGQDGFFVYIQSGRNVRWSNSSVNSISNSKLGVGVVIKQTEHKTMYVDVFSKSRQLETKDFVQKGYYTVNGYGLSLGLIFN